MTRGREVCGEGQPVKDSGIPRHQPQDWQRGIMPRTGSARAEAKGHRPGYNPARVDTTTTGFPPAMGQVPSAFGQSDDAHFLSPSQHPLIPMSAYPGNPYPMRKDRTGYPTNLAWVSDLDRPSVGHSIPPQSARHPNIRVAPNLPTKQEATATPPPRGGTTSSNPSTPPTNTPSSSLLSPTYAQRLSSPFINNSQTLLACKRIGNDEHRRNGVPSISFRVCRDRSEGET